MVRRGRRQSPCAVNRGCLLRRLNVFFNENKGHKNPEEIVAYLRSTFPEYRRFHVQVLNTEVLILLNEYQDSQHSIDMRENSKYADSLLKGRRGDALPSTGPSRKKSKRSDESEERLLRLEAQHLHRRDMKLDDLTISGSSSSTGSSSVDDKKDASHLDVYERKLEPEFDLTQSMLRKKYIDMKTTPKLVEKNIEVEEVGEKTNKVDLIKESDITSKTCARDVSSGDTKKMDGPMFRDFGGMEALLTELKKKVVYPLLHDTSVVNVRPLTGILLHGPPGCGKTMLARAIANETGFPFYSIDAPEIVSGVSGVSEENIRELFSKARRTAPSIVFIDEIDAIASKQENMQKGMERRIVTQLLCCMNTSNLLNRYDGDKSNFVFVIGATNKPEALDSSCRRAGRFEKEFALDFPDENGRTEILSMLIHKLKVEGSLDLMKIARSTSGFVGADLTSLVNEAKNCALSRILDKRIEHSITNNHIGECDEWLRRPLLPEEIGIHNVTMVDFEEATKIVQPSSRREGFSTIPNVTWNDVGGFVHLRKELHLKIVVAITSPWIFKDFGIQIGTGFLLYGPPGCGKTLIARAVAGESGASFIHIKGPEILNKYVGESESAIRRIFTRARTCAPCIIFFDEVDSLMVKRGNDSDPVGARISVQLLAELDDAKNRGGVFIIGATNRPELIDPAFLRCGRFDKRCYVPLPTPKERGLILKTIATGKPIDPSVDLIDIGQMEACHNMNGADLTDLMNVATFEAMNSCLKNCCGEMKVIKTRHFLRALKKVKPSVSDKDRKYYNKVRKSFAK